MVKVQAIAISVTGVMYSFSVDAWLTKGGNLLPKDEPDDIHLCDVIHFFSKRAAAEFLKQLEASGNDRNLKFKLVNHWFGSRTKARSDEG